MTSKSIEEIVLTVLENHGFNNRHVNVSLMPNIDSGFVVEVHGIDDGDYFKIYDLIRLAQKNLNYECELFPEVVEYYNIDTEYAGSKLFPIDLGATATFVDGYEEICSGDKHYMVA